MPSRARAPISPSRWIISRISAAARHGGGDLRFLRAPGAIIRTIEPLRFHGNEVVLFHVLDPQEIRPRTRRALHADRSGNARSSMEVTPEYARNEYRKKMDAHIEALRDRARGCRHGLLPARDRPAARWRAARIPHHPAGEELDGLSRSLVPGRRARLSGCPSISICCGATRPRRSRSAR